MLPYLACMALTAQFYALPPRVLPSIQAVEGGRPGLVRADSDGSADLGLMQINTRWVPNIAEAAGLSPDQARARLINDACFSIAAAGAIMRAYLRETGGDLMLAVGDYHSHTPGLNQAYQQAVLGRARELFR